MYMRAVNPRQLVDYIEAGTCTAYQRKVLPNGLPVVRPIRRLRIDIQAVVKTVGTSANADALRRLIDYIAIKANGNTDFVNISGEALYQKNLRDYKTSKLVDDWPSSATTISASFVIDFAVDPVDTNDLSAVLPAQDFNSLALEFGLNPITSAAAADSALTSLNIYVVVEEAMLSNAEFDTLFGKNREKLLGIMWTQITQDVTATHSAYSGKIEMQTGQILQSALVRTYVTATGVASSNKIDSYMIKQLGGASDFIWDDQMFHTAILQDIAENSVQDVDAIKGTFLFNPAIRTEYGIPLQSVRNGDFNFLFNNASATDFSIEVTHFLLTTP